MASLQCQKPVAQQTVCQKTTNTATCHKANEHHSLADKMKEMTTKMLHHDNHGQQSACHGAKTQHSAGHGSTAIHGRATASRLHAMEQNSTFSRPWLHCYAWKSW
uniref:Putative ovule protein n=1 Tax=Solanum chacoense TaxID=4108 RepID=A0A0V0H5Z4_SOLCH